MSLPVAKSKRDPYWDAVRGILIILVIWIHASSGVQFQFSATAWNFDYWVVARQLFNFPVAFFLFLAGYFVVQKHVSPKWIGSRAKRLLIPFFIWSFIYGIITLVATDTYTSVLNFLANVALGQTSVHLYFILVLVQLTVLTPLFIKLLHTKWAWMPFLITPLYITGMYIYALTVGELPPFYGTFFAGWSAFYFAGLWMQARPVQIPPLKGAVAIAGALFIVSIIEAYLLISSGGPVSLAISQLSISSIVYSFAIFGLALALKQRQKQMTPPNWVVQLGTVSYGVYFVHIVWIFALTPITKWLLAVFPVLPVVQILLVVTVVFLSVVSIQLTKRVIGKKYAALLFGF